MPARAAPIFCKRVRRRALPALSILLLSACADLVPPTAATPAVPDGDPLQAVGTADPWFPPAFLTSTGDTCAGYLPPPELEAVFWSGSDEEWIANPDSVWAADSARVSDPDYFPSLALLDPFTGAELLAGPCEVLYNRCIRTCRRLRGRPAALCYAACMARYSGCLADEEVRRRRRPPAASPPDSCDREHQIVYDHHADEPCGSGGTGGGAYGSGEAGSTCHTEWIVIEVDNGTGWKTWWGGNAVVCE